MNVFVVVDDWGYDGQSVEGVGMSLNAAKHIAKMDAYTEGLTVEEWSEPDESPHRGIREWKAKCGNREYVITEFAIQQ